ncbi:MAG TPA: RsmB/NOP family class I SAM-dependent RNA methyltransferase, partial [Rhodospirillales bacterium]|nr:RsmB/NOP family class I SAM-dependent RNA methyltransferase [Rhodospirillales bacterium]
EYPDWLEDPLRKVFGEDLEREVAALNEAAPVDLRINRAKTTREKAQDLLGGEGIETTPCPHAPMGLRLKNRANVTGTKAFQDGLVEIQDEGSQIVALLTAVRPGMTAVDFCAGAGGKTLALAAIMEGQGRVHACDTDVSRLKRMTERLRRAQPGNVRSHTLVKNDPWIAEQTGEADRVLLDAPCSGSGVWRRAPEAKWRLTPEKLAGYCATQSQILEQAKGLVKPGGRLVFATCSILREENEDQVERFLAVNPDFSLMDGAAVWADVLGRPCPVKGPMPRLGPATTFTDGFFCAVFERTA